MEATIWGLGFRVAFRQLELSYHHGYAYIYMYGN